ncbi:MAG: phosphoglucosamine mutase [Bacillota bacterium]|nr:phosphoglucosamine mutase [Bacillota bacterium]
MPELFGTDGVRGRPGEDLTAELALRLGASCGRLLGEGAVLLTRDTRESGPFLAAALAAGFMSQGLDVWDVGVAPTPAAAYLTGSLGAVGGAVVSASHNPAADNGIKFLNRRGDKFPESLEEEVEEGLGQALALPSRFGRLENREEALEDYVRHLVASLEGPLPRWKVVLDCAHGATYKTAPEAFARAGLDVVVMGAAPDGRNINDGVGSQHPRALREAVLAHGAFAGFAFDGDGDRCLAVTAEGEILGGDEMLAIFARDLPPGQVVVGTVMTNGGLEAYLQGRGLTLLRTPVGDRHVAMAMEEHGAPYGGESSGHVIVRAFARTGDGTLTALQLLQKAKEHGQSLGELVREFRPWPSVQKALPLPPGFRFQREAYQDLLQEAERILDGAGRILVRPSGTEPVLRVLVEGQDGETVERTAARLAQALQERMRG